MRAHDRCRNIKHSPTHAHTTVANDTLPYLWGRHVAFACRPSGYCEKVSRMIALYDYNAIDSCGNPRRVRARQFQLLP